MVAIGMGRRAPPLVAAELQIAVAETFSPRHENVIEHDQASTSSNRDDRG